MLAVPGGVAALVLAYWTAFVLIGYAAAGRAAIVLDVSPGWRVLAFTALCLLVAGLVLGCVPAIRASRADRLWAGRDVVADAGVGSTAGPGQSLVILQMALSLVLLVGAGLFVRSLQN